MLNLDRRQIFTLFKLAAFGAFFSFVSYFCFSSLIHITEYEISRFIKFSDSGNLDRWFYYDFSSWLKGVNKFFFWFNAAFLGILGFVSLVFAKALLSRAEQVIKDEVNA